jgi:hypothetical protein
MHHHCTFFFPDPEAIHSFLLAICTCTLYLMLLAFSRKQQQMDYRTSWGLSAHVHIYHASLISYQIRKVHIYHASLISYQIRKCLRSQTGKCSWDLRLAGKTESAFCLCHRSLSLANWHATFGELTAGVSILVGRLGVVHASLLSNCHA